MKTIGFYYTKSSKVSGCQKVGVNTLLGLRQLGYDVRENQRGDMNGCIHGTDKFRNRTLPRNTLIGVEIICLPSEDKSMYSHWKHFIHPSLWVREYMMKFPVAQKSVHHVWPCGIDTEVFNDNLRSDTFKYDVLIYYKNVTAQTPQSNLRKVESELRSRGLSYKTIKYGSYQEDEMRRLTAECKVCIYLAGTESQGIGIMEMMACGIPIYVMDVNTFKYRNFTHTSPLVSSAPYFGDYCGEKVNGVNFSKFELLFESYNDYKPRQYILDNHTILKGAEKYVNILKEMNGFSPKKDCKGCSINHNGLPFSLEWSDKCQKGK